MERIIDEAMRLDSSARGFIVEILLESLDVGTDFEASGEWGPEIGRRCVEIERGAVTRSPGDEAFAELRVRDLAEIKIHILLVYAAVFCVAPRVT